MAAWLPEHLRGWALLQPSFQAYEMIRAGMFGNAVKTYGDPAYTSMVLAVLTFIGLLLMRESRKYVVDGMIEAVNVTKEYRTEGRVHRAVSDVSFSVARGEKLAVLGRNGAGKSTLIRLLGRVELPTSGTIEQTMSVSWPLALQGGFQGSLTGNDNMRFIARIYNKPFDEIKEYVEDFAELGKYLSEPVKIYSIGMRARFAFALSLAIDFDCYLIDEVIAAGDQRFQRRSHEELFEKRADRTLILASHMGDVIKSYCSRALVMHHGRGNLFDDIDLALQVYNDL